MITFDSSANGHYLSETDRIAVHLSILRASTKCVGVANRSTSKALHTSCLPFKHLSNTASTTDSFPDFLQSIMSIGKICYDGTISIFAWFDITIHKETDVLITCKRKPILIGIRANTANTVYHSSKPKDIGNHNNPPNEHVKHFTKLTVSMTSPPPNRQ
jgi:hypothetical protein